jgi:hypothetical protein
VYSDVYLKSMPQEEHMLKRHSQEVYSEVYLKRCLLTLFRYTQEYTEVVYSGGIGVTGVYLYTHSGIPEEVYSGHIV